MTSMSDTKGLKRPHESDDDGVDDDPSVLWIGPMPSEAVKHKQGKVLDHEQLYMNHLPCAGSYEKSYMHRDCITHLLLTKSDFLITGSSDGHIKFWKKVDELIEFVKHFRSHLGPIQALAANYDGTLLCSTSVDKSIKVFDVLNFDMINMLKLDYTPNCAEWIHSSSDATIALVISDANSGSIYLYDIQTSNQALRVFDKLHRTPVVLMKYNKIYDVVVSVDARGFLEYWGGPRSDYEFPKCVTFDSKLDTDLYEFTKTKTSVTGLEFTPNGKRFATLSTDRKIRIFIFVTGRLSRVYDESLQRFSDLQQVRPQLPSMEFGRRMATERDLDKSDSINFANIVFDESGNFILYATMLGIKVVNIYTNKCVRLLGKSENLRLLNLALFQGRGRKTKAAVTVEMEASENPTLDAASLDPLVFCTAFKKNRFYIFSRREPGDTRTADAERDVFNEKPSKEDIISATEAAGVQQVYENAIIHTTLGDIHVKLFPKECPRTVENFTVHSKNGYYNGHVFHRIIKGFMVQTGDPTGTGTGGESIWGTEFEDEFHPLLRHDRPYTFSMANGGPNTNASQFFITVIPTPWLDNKHSVFGRVVKGMEVVQNISNVKTNPKTDKPYDDVQIISVTLK